MLVVANPHNSHQIFSAVWYFYNVKFSLSKKKNHYSSDTPILYSPHRYGQLCVDCQLKIFDLRAMRPVTPCNVTMLQPFLVKCYPHLGSTILVLSQMGEFQFLDVRGLVTPSNMIVNQLSVGHEGRAAMACTVDVGLSSCIAFGDSSGIVHLWTNEEAIKGGEEITMNPYAQPSIFPDELEETPFISWDDDDPNPAPLSAIPTYLSPHTP